MTMFNVKQFVETMAAPELKGRVPGTEGHRVAKELVIATFEQFGMEQVIPGTWEQPFVTSDGVHCANLLAYKPGKADSKQWVLLGAHYDHCIGEDGHIDLGANDNAASVAVVFDAVQQLQSVHHDCHVVLAIFDTEEPPYYATSDMGSERFYAQMPARFEVEHLQVAVILDLIGHDILVDGREEAVLAIGVDSGAALSPAVRLASETSGLDVYRFGKGIPFSDHMVFERNQQPFVFLSSGMAWHYHSQHDTPAILNYSKMAKVSSFLKEMVLALGCESDSAVHLDAQEPARELVRFFEPALGAGASVGELLVQKLSASPDLVNGALFRINGILRGTTEKITLQKLLTMVIGSIK